MKVLLTDGGHKNSLAIIRYIGKLHKVYLLHHKKSAPAYSKYCSKLIICPHINKGIEYYDFVLDLIKKEKFDLIIPVGIKAVEIFSQHLDELRRYTKIELLAYEQLKPALFKFETFKLAEQYNIPHPRTVYPSSIDDALSLASGLLYPLIIKSSNEAVLKFPTAYIQNKAELEANLKQLHLKYSEEMLKAYPLIQEKIEGDGYGFFAVCQGGSVKKICMHRRLREIPASGGSSTCAITIFDEELKAVSEKILNILQWHGQIMIEFKKDRNDGLFKLIEINPKFWGSLELCLAAGMNFPLHLCEMAEGKELVYSEKYKHNLRFQWLISTNGDLYRLFEKPSDVFRVIADFFKSNTVSDLYFSDFKPSLMEIVYFLIFIKHKLFK